MSARDHLERVHEIPCVVCVKMGMPPKYPVTAHHLESVRDELSDYATVALCEEHHDPFRTGSGIHGLSRRGFEMKYKLSELDLLKLTLWLLDKAGKL
jgi:hypothetical protein